MTNLKISFLVAGFWLVAVFLRFIQLVRAGKIDLRLILPMTSLTLVGAAAILFFTDFSYTFELFAIGLMGLIIGTYSTVQKIVRLLLNKKTPHKQ